DRKGEEVERGRMVEVEAEGRGTREAAYAVVAVGHGDPAVGGSPKHLRQRERERQEPQARGAQRDQTESRRHERGARQSKQRRRPVEEPQLEMQERANVRGDAEIGGVAE